MRSFTRKRMKELFDEASAGIKNSRGNAQVLERVAPFGYTEESLSAGEELLKKAERLYLEKGPKKGKKINVSMKLRKDIKEIHAHYILYVNVLRRELREDAGLQEELQLKGERDNSLVGMVKEPKGFYLYCLEHDKVGAVVIKYGLSKEKLESCLEQIAVVEKDSQYRALLVMESEKATEDRNKAVLALSDWWQNYRDVLKYVFRDDPQQLEGFKIKAYSDGYKRRSGTEEENGKEPEAGVKMVKDSSITGSNKKSKKRLRK